MLDLGLRPFAPNLRVEPLVLFDLALLRTVRSSLAVYDNAVLRQCFVGAIKNALTTGPTSYTATGNNGMPNTCP